MKKIIVFVIMFSIACVGQAMEEGGKKEGSENLKNIGKNINKEQEEINNQRAWANKWEYRKNHLFWEYELRRIKKDKKNMTKREREIDDQMIQHFTRRIQEEILEDY